MELEGVIVIVAVLVVVASVEVLVTVSVVVLVTVFVASPTATNRLAEISTPAMTIAEAMMRWLRNG